MDLTAGAASPLLETEATPAPRKPQSRTIRFYRL